MKRMAFLLVALLIVGVSLVWAQMPAGGPPKEMLKMDKGRFGEHGMGPMGPRDWWNDPEVREVIGLSQDQVDKIDALAVKLQKQEIENRAQMQLTEIDIEQAFKAQSLDEAKIKSLIEKMANLKAAEVKAHAQFRLDVAKILTNEQREKLKVFLRQKMEQRGRFGAPGGFLPQPQPQPPLPPGGDEND